MYLFTSGCVISVKGGVFSCGIIWMCNLYPISLHRVFHGIRFKVNKDWDSAEPLFLCSCFLEPSV